MTLSLYPELWHVTGKFHRNLCSVIHQMEKFHRNLCSVIHQMETIPVYWSYNFKKMWTWSWVYDTLNALPQSLGVRPTALFQFLLLSFNMVKYEIVVIKQNHSMNEMMLLMSVNMTGRVRMQQLWLKGTAVPLYLWHIFISSEAILLCNHYTEGDFRSYKVLLRKKK